MERPASRRHSLLDETRLAFTGGLSLVPQAFSRGLEIRLRTLVTSVRAQADGFTVETESGESYSGRDAAVCLALEQSLALIQGLGVETAGAAAVLGMFTSLPCLTVVAGYPAAGGAAADWDVLYPDDSAAVMVVGQRDLEARLRARAHAGDPGKPALVP